MRSLIEIALSAEAQQAGTSESFRVGVRNAKDDEPAEIAIYGTVGDPWEGSDARSIGAFLRANKGRDINVRINSAGGLYYDGVTIHNALLQHDGKVTTIIEGLAGSAASLIAMAGDPVQIYENAQIFVHRALLIAIGNVDMMDEAKSWLTKIDDAIAATYKAKTNKATETIRGWMKGKVDGTVFSAREALDVKLVDEILSLKDGKAKNDAPDFAREAQNRLPSMEFLRAQRLRAHRELFVPAE